MESRRNGPQLSSRHDDDDDDGEKNLVAYCTVLKIPVCYL